MSINIPPSNLPHDEHTHRRQAALVITDLLEEDDLFRQEVAALINIDPDILKRQTETISAAEMQDQTDEIKTLQDTVNDLRAQLELAQEVYPS